MRWLNIFTAGQTDEVFFFRLSPFALIRMGDALVIVLTSANTVHCHSKRRERHHHRNDSPNLKSPKRAQPECIVRNSNEASRPSQSTRRLYREQRAVGNAKHGHTVLASPTAVIASSARRACRPSLSAGSLTLPLVRSTSNGRADKKTYAYGTAALRPFAT